MTPGRLHESSAADFAGDEKEAMDIIREAITAWLWAEDQKGTGKLGLGEGRKPLLVSV